MQFLERYQNVISGEYIKFIKNENYAGGEVAKAQELLAAKSLVAGDFCFKCGSFIKF